MKLKELFEDRVFMKHILKFQNFLDDNGIFENINSKYKLLKIEDKLVCRVDIDYEFLKGIYWIVNDDYGYSFCVKEANEEFSTLFYVNDLKSARREFLFLVKNYILLSFEKSIRNPNMDYPGTSLIKLDEKETIKLSIHLHKLPIREYIWSIDNQCFEWKDVQLKTSNEFIDHMNSLK